MKHKRIMQILALITAAAMLLSGCAATQENTDKTSTEKADTENISTKSKDEMLTDRDYEVGYDEKDCIEITLKDTTAACDSSDVKISGNTVTISGDGAYILSGTLDGTVEINADKSAKPHIILKNANITSSDSAALNIIQADKVFVTVDSGTKNTLSNSGEFKTDSDTNIDGAIFSKDDLTFNGSGSLIVSSPNGHGIVCKDDLVFTSGKYEITSSSHGIDANDSVRVANATLDISSGKDGIHVENSDDTTLGFVYILSGNVKIESEGDGISSSAYTQIENGEINIVSGGGSENAQKKTSDNQGGFKGGFKGDANGDPGAMHGGMKDGNQAGMHGGMRGDMQDGMQMQTPEAQPTAFENNPVQTTETTDESTSIKGLKSDSEITVNGGKIKINSADDAIHSNSKVTVNSGELNLTSGDDGIHADDTLTIKSGTVVVNESYEGLEAQNIDIQGGDISVTATDDGLNAVGGNDSSGFGGPRGNDTFGGMGNKGGLGSQGNGTLKISGGKIDIKAKGDCIDSNGSLSITGGTVTVSGPTTGDTSPLDYDSSSEITGGTFIATGSSNMAQTFSNASQGVIVLRTNNQSEKTKLTVKDSSGKEIISQTPTYGYNYIIISSPEIAKGSTYTVTAGSTSHQVMAN